MSGNNLRTAQLLGQQYRNASRLQPPITSSSLMDGKVETKDIFMGPGKHPTDYASKTKRTNHINGSPVSTACEAVLFFSDLEKSESAEIL